MDKIKSERLLIRKVDKHMGKNKGLGMVSALAVGAGVAALAAGKKYKTAETKKKEEYDALHNTSEYRNTERGKYEKDVYKRQGKY